MKKHDQLGVLLSLAGLTLIGLHITGVTATLYVPLVGGLLVIQGLPFPLAALLNTNARAPDPPRVMDNPVGAPPAALRAAYGRGHRITSWHRKGQGRPFGGMEINSPGPVHEDERAGLDARDNVYLRKGDSDMGEPGEFSRQVEIPLLAAEEVHRLQLEASRTGAPSPILGQDYCVTASFNIDRFATVNSLLAHHLQRALDHAEAKGVPAAIGPQSHVGNISFY